MNIGIDLDNTIISYDDIYKSYLIYYNINIKDSKTCNYKSLLKDNIISKYGVKKWSILQGNIYGAKLKYAKPYNGVLNFLNYATLNNIKVYIISHKTKYPVIGPRINLRKRAMLWLSNNDFFDKTGLNSNDVIFTDSIENKIKNINLYKLNIFIDDLDLIIYNNDINRNITLIHFTNIPKMDIIKNNIHRKKNWAEILSFLKVYKEV